MNIPKKIPMDQATEFRASTELDLGENRKWRIEVSAFTLEDLYEKINEVTKDYEENRRPKYAAGQLPPSR